jgi:hypothetical protein
MNENRFVRLSRKDVTAGVEQKGNLDYLSWAYAWIRLCEDCPDATYYFGEPSWFPDQSVMVKAGVCVGEITHEMTLPVMDHRNKAIQNPNARDISDAQMRCFVKAIAMHGVGIGLYLGKLKTLVEQGAYEKSVALIDAGDAMGFHALIKSLGSQDLADMFNAAPSGQKVKFKDAYRATLKQAESFIDSIAEALIAAVEGEDEVLLQETVEELTPYERRVAFDRLDGEQQQAVINMRKTA